MGRNYFIFVKNYLIMKKEIKIKPENKGKFTAYANSKGESVQGAARKIFSMGKNKPTPALKKEAVFAKNFSGKKK